MEYKSMSFKEKKLILEHFFKQYHKAKFMLFCLENRSYYPRVDYGAVHEPVKQYGHNKIAKMLNSQLEKKEELEKVVSLFEMMIDTLEPEYRRIIDNDFLNKKSNNWWNEYYAKSTYYRIKQRAMNELLYYLML